ncbi:MAG: phosphotriesterase-related protein [Verrucomicrobia bacterium]|nr:phosphotriesterase-related protein [Verrucomicrobiota bacterium]
MSRVMTVLGPVKPEELGITLPHEHILLDLGPSIYGFNAVLDDIELAIDELRAFKNAGGGALVDCTLPSIGRDVEVQKKVAEATGLHIIAGTGYYKEAGYPRHVYELTTNQLADRMIDELTNGIEGTAIRAGIIGEIATGQKFVTPAEERVFRAAARAHLQTGATITTHTYFGLLAFEQLALLEEEGANLSRVIIGHLGDKRDIDLLRAIAAKGVFLEVDHIGHSAWQLDEQRARTVAQLIRDGYLSQILLSQDVCFKSCLHWFGGTGYDHLLRNFVPMLAAEGVSEAQVNTMLMNNPQRALAYDV